MKRVSILVAIAVLLSTLALACAPKSVPTPPVSAPAPPTPAAAPPKPALATISPADAKWATVVEAAKKEGNLVFLASTPFAGDIGTTISRAFKEKTGINIEILVGRGGTNYERVKTEKRSGQQVTTIVEGAGLYMKLMKSEGLLTPMTDVPVFQDSSAWLLHPFALDTEGYIIGFLINYFGPYANTNKVKKEDWPSSLQDFLKPKWKGEMLLSDPRTGSGTYWYYASLVRRGIIGWDYVKALQGQDLKLAPNAAAAAQTVSRGEFPISLMSFAADTAAIVDAGAPIKLLTMKEGSIFTLEPFGVVNGGSHPNAAKVFLNWFFSEEGQRVHSNVAKHNPLRKDTPNIHPKNVIPSEDPSVKKISVTMDDFVEAEQLFKEGHIAKLLGLAR